MKTIYYIGFHYGELSIGSVPVKKETEKMYYIERGSYVVELNCGTQFHKSAEGRRWTTDEGKFKELAQKYVDEALRLSSQALRNAQIKHERLKDEIKDLGLEVRE